MYLSLNKMRDFFRSITPQFILDWYRKVKKDRRNRKLHAQKNRGEIVTQKMLVTQLKGMGIKKGDVLLVHASLSKMGYVEGGPKTVVDALLEVVGEEGHLLMPNSPNASLQLDYIRNVAVFDVKESPSKLGAISEYFRKLPNVIRSEHPTEPVSCVGHNAMYFVKDHFGAITPYSRTSPFYRVAEQGGKILYIGVTLDNAGTSLHILEDAVENFVFPVYADEVFDVQVKRANGQIETMRTRVHNPEQSAKRKCDELIPLFEENGVLKHVMLGEAKTLLVQAKEMVDCMLEQYEKNGVTMYTPKGNKNS